MGGGTIWRRRVCATCKKIFSTYESPRLDFLIVKKKNTTTTRYRSYKLYASLYDAISGGKEKDHGDAAREAEEVLLAIEKRILLAQFEVVKTSELIDMATDLLEKTDLGACYRYASFAPYRGMKFGI